ncbi:hypothetical protein HZH66_012048 [Vespula vulgaris]|uniref:Uncharacterized protein n=1 Tax=Vespula vulgaris TaxID=7454 RepID=A0A834MTP1_VESVU|nr:hypothetical protein HZH66_012048 [Vespula vulgaris]
MVPVFLDIKFYEVTGRESVDSPEGGCASRRLASYEDNERPSRRKERYRERKEPCRIFNVVEVNKTIGTQFCRLVLKRF